MMLDRTVGQISSDLEEGEEGEEEKGKGKGKEEEHAKLESGIEVEDVTSNTQVISQGIRLDSDISPVKKPSPRCSRVRPKFTASKTSTFFGTF